MHYRLFAFFLLIFLIFDGEGSILSLSKEVLFINSYPIKRGYRIDP